MLAACATPSERSRGGSAAPARDASSAPATSTPATTKVILRERRPASWTAEDLVASLGGRVTRPLPIVGGFAATVPPEALGALAGSPAVLRVWPDGRVRMSAFDAAAYAAAEPNENWRRAIGLPADFREGGPDGAGVTVALLDTGLTRVEDLRGRVVARVDLTPEHDGLDRYGHGSHMAGLIAGDGMDANGAWQGVAPRAGIVSVKVAGFNGATDVSAVLAGIQWVVSHRERYGIRVLNLSYGTDSVQTYRRDPLNFAVERAWSAGILVVVAAGNRGPVAGTIDKPGDDPFVVTVGAANLAGTVNAADDSVAPFSARGPTIDGVVKPDLVAPGIGMVSLRAPESAVDQAYPEAVVDGSYFKGTGTSQAAAVVSGVAALMFAANPSITPDVAKATLVRTARKALAGRSGAGAGLVNASAAVAAAASGKFTKSPANRNLRRSNGLGTLVASRGTFHAWADVDGDGEPELVAGETTVLGETWAAGPWARGAWTEATWRSTRWARLTATTPGFDETSWSGPTWGGMGWDAKSWGAKSWSELTWSAKSWSVDVWSSR